jgi:pimeloyl-ACP methyl ester carboxylesterase
VADFADNIDDLLAAVEAPRAFVVAGHFAALPAIELAVAHPGRVAALWLDGPPVWPAEMRTAVASSTAGAAPERWEMGADMGGVVWQRLTGMLKKLAPDGFEPGPPLTYALRRALIDFTEASFEPTTVSAMVGYDAVQRAALVRCPTRVVAGEYDEQGRSQPLITAAIPRAQAQTIGGLHPMHDLAHPDRAGEYVDLVLTFFAALTTAPT